MPNNHFNIEPNSQTMKLNQPKVKDAKELSRLIFKVIQTTPCYSVLGKKLESEKYSLSQVRRKLKDKNFLFLTVKDKNKIVAFLVGYYDCGTFWSDWIGVDVKYRRSHLASALKSRLEEILRTKNIHKIWVDTLVNNKEAINMQRALGYKKVATLTNHWYHDSFYIWEKVLG